MLALLLIMQAPVRDSNYSTPALEAFVAEAAAANRTLPPTLAAYRASLESDIAILARTGAQQELAQQLEQVASRLQWSRSGTLDQRIVGYRSRVFGPSLSALTALRSPWVVSTLYGDRLRFGLAEPSGQPVSAGAVMAIHPLASDRDKVYRFSGGDTVMVLQTPGRTIHLAQVHVEPRVIPHDRTLVFRGDLLIDAERKQVVRMRGEFAVVAAHRSPITRLRETALETMIFAELVDGELEERFWLPTYQRIEIQMRSRVATEFRPVFRIVTHFRDYEVKQGDLPGPALKGSSVRLTFAPSDSMNGFSGWNREIGTAVTAVAATDFDDVAPDAWRTTGEPRLDVAAARPSEIARFNRVEGLFLGPSARFSFRDAAPGLALSSHFGWSFAEQTARGGVTGGWTHGRWRATVVAERALVNTNDFVPVLEGEATLGALIGTIDDFDYVDRWKASVLVTRDLGAPNAWRLKLELGPGRDQSEIARVQHGLFYRDSLFRPNRPAAEGSYFRQAIGLEYHPNLSGEYLEPGVGAGISYERGDGGLAWQRVEGRILGRHTYNGFMVGARLDAAAVFGGTPPQQLIAFGENEGLPGYGYKEFGGNRAALLRGGVTYELPVLRSPLRPRRWLVLPNISPAIGVTLQSGWTQASNPAVAATLLSFGYRDTPDPATGQLVPVTRPTDGIRSTVTFSLGLFGGALGVGIARPLDHPAPWVFVLGTGGAW